MWSKFKEVIVESTKTVYGYARISTRMHTGGW